MNVAGDVMENAGSYGMKYGMCEKDTRVDSVHAQILIDLGLACALRKLCGNRMRWWRSLPKKVSHARRRCDHVIGKVQKKSEMSVRKEGANNMLEDR